MKPTSSYKMSGLTKMMLASTGFRNVEDRNAWKRAMIEAELSAESARRTNSKSKSKTPE
jgi:hypothetical protein